ncbi:MAG TPA: hypothetical protein VGG64_22315 [Pirellulales bacterium]|jgi:hypothetical protein
MHNGERTVIAGGLIGGLLVGVLLFKGGISAGKTDAVVVAVPATSPSADALSPDPEVEALKKRIAVLEKKQLARRLAELEAATEESAEIDDSLADRQEHPALPTRRPAVSAQEIETPPRKRGAEQPAAEKPSAGQTTLGYWNALNDVIARESAMRAPPANVTAANAGEFVGARLKAGRFASEALGALDARGVDAEALQLGRELMAWYREEVTLNERATSLLGSASAADRKGAAGSWRSGEEQHRRKCDEINRHGAALRARLARKYGLAFPPLN